jgi:hypothetical protein
MEEIYNENKKMESEQNKKKEILQKDIEVADLASLLETEENISSSEENPLNEEYELCNGVKIGMAVVIVGLVVAIIVVNNN